MKGVNEVVLLGNVGKDPECRTTSTGKVMASFNLGTNYTLKDKTQGVDWHKVVFFGHVAEYIQQHIKKGDRLYIKGALKTNNFIDRTTGQKKYITQVVGTEIISLSPKAESINYDKVQPQSNSYSSSKEDVDIPF